VRLADVQFGTQRAVVACLTGEVDLSNAGEIRTLVARRRTMRFASPTSPATCASP
jgi:hypothetical protein